MYPKELDKNKAEHFPSQRFWPYSNHETNVLIDELSVFFFLILYSNEKWNFKWLIKSKVRQGMVRKSLFMHGKIQSGTKIINLIIIIILNVKTVQFYQEK